MNTVGEELRRLLIDQTDIRSYVGNRVHQNHMPEKSEYPAVGFIRSGQFQDVTLDGASGPKRAEFDLECMAETVGEAESLSDEVWGYLHGLTTVGTSDFRTFHGVFCESQDDDYIPRVAGSDEGVTVSSLSVTIWHSTGE